MEDSIIGINGYSTDTPGIDGNIKYDPESFIVNEIPVTIPENNNGKYTILKVRLRNWDTNKFLMYLADQLHISNKRITYAGTKDKIGITTQYFCINMPENQQINNISIKDAEIISSFRTDKLVKLGDLLGNEFIISIQSTDDNTQKIGETVESIVKNGGFPNFYGYQRFGSIRANTHKIGKLLVQNKYEDAVKTYIYDPEFDREDYRRTFGETGDAKRAIKEFPEYLTFERSLLGYIIRENTYKNAFSVFPRNLSMLFIHAYQSYLFNRILSDRMKYAGSMHKVLEGDLLYPVDRYFNPDRSQLIRASSYNIEKLNNLSRENRIRTVIPLIGYSTELSSGIEGEIESRIMAEEGIEKKDFNLSSDRRLGSSGDYRIMSVLPVDFKIIEKNRINFSLGKGIYATSLLRELIKGDLN
ncbi:tRNA pseudouridine(13) synthase TruD [Ferroplasma acidiphilum]|uniref:Probable tRNA pseudouridine synthase D n=1 Tax=Ferroplasma acidiphilum TaxID=74969 RepID=A0A1V0N682_9ARCH|nr:tRNA pseudouridine(13) synthase TruD [Ferroplasma acidiphilum]ARD85621.1 tRNA pseudouridine synthase D [Ferroplasma acidiphilum]MCL4349460.1 tRNA pseudouridine(13) synthase TruD [Candidatus Thermoplasmatota archaeon]NOL60775.1 tRNA pseudouridine(13) synthase TruD [Ferroplasma acidiphilum]WMT52756.1 MAG: tRNA pseudouridine(13) synthase TruD [Ferroplasma acidiphilum]